MRINAIVGAALIGLLLLSPVARAAVWNELTNGDISGDRNNPSVLTLAPGTNSIIGTTGGGDLDYLRLVLPAGGALQSFTLSSYASNDGTAFIGMQRGATFTEDPNTANPANLLGYTHFGPGAGNVGSDILPAMGRAPGAQGFTPPLTGGPYTLWIQQLGATTTYQFNAVATPEPASGILVLAAAAICLRRRR